MTPGSRSVVAPLQFLIAAALLIVGLEVLVMVPAAVFEKVGVSSKPGAYLGGAFAGLVALAIAIWSMRRIPAPLAALATKIPTGRFGGIFLAIAVGVVLRLALNLISSIEPQSDARVYTQIAAALADGQPYYIAHRWAYWPVGYPFLLSLWFRVGGGSLFGIHLLNQLLFVTMSLGVWRLCKAVVQPAAGRLAVWLLALWPDLVALATWPSKELLVMALLPWCIALAIEAPGNMRRDIVRRVIAGVLGGLSVLVQPSFILLLPVVPLIGWLARTQAPRQVALTWILVMVCAAATIAPWTIRNYRVLGAFVPVATNGGEVLYRANNPLATGEYVKRGEVDLWVLPELDAHREGLRLAKQWIAAHPGEFLALAVKKQAFFLEDDAIGIYEVFNRGHVGEAVPGAVYFLLKAVCNAWWWLLWLILSASLWIVVRRRPQSILDSLALGLPLLYLYGIHSVFESGPRYHQPADPFVAITVAAMIGVLLARDRASTHA